MATYQDPRPYDVEYIENPSQPELRELALAHTPCVLRSSVGSVNKVTRNKSRVAKYTYVLDTEDRWSHQIIDPEKGRALIERLKDKSEPGIEFLWAEELVNGDPRVTRVIDAAEYVLGVPRRELAERGLGTVEALRERIASRRAGAEEGSLVVIRLPKESKAGLGGRRL